MGHFHFGQLILEKWRSSLNVNLLPVLYGGCAVNPKLPSWLNLRSFGEPEKIERRTELEATQRSNALH